MTRPPACRIAPPHVLTEPALASLLDLLPEARLVGGIVRDVIAGRPFADIDLASPLPPETVMARLTDAGLKVLPTGLAHGTVTAVLPGRPREFSRGLSAGRSVEITTLRRDVETDGRHAVVAFTDDWRADAARRDFTINAMSMTRDGSVFDYFGGLDDLRAGRLRFVGAPADRVAEDYLRVLRFFRFFARYGGTEPDPATSNALRDAVPRLTALSVERVWSELVRILAAPDPICSIRLMDRLGVLPAVIPEGTHISSLTSLVARGAPADPLLRMGALLAGDIVAFAARLKLAIADRDRLIALRNCPLPRPEDDDAALRRLLADRPASALIDRTWLAGGDTPGWALVRQRLRDMPKPVFPIEGRDILSFGLAPGPMIGEVLRLVRVWWLIGGCTADSDACLDEAGRTIQRLSGAHSSR